MLLHLRDNKGEVIIRKDEEGTKEEAMRRRATNRIIVKTVSEVIGSISMMISSSSMMVDTISDREGTEKEAMAGISMVAIELRSRCPISGSTICTIFNSMRPSLRKRSHHMSSKYSCSLKTSEIVEAKSRNSPRRRSSRTMQI